MKIYAFVLGLVFFGFFNVASTQAQYNILFLISDDMNDWIGCLGGHPDVITPNIDRLADRAILFEQAHCSAPICNPSRASVMSGLNPFHYRMLWQQAGTSDVSGWI